MNNPPPSDRALDKEIRVTLKKAHRLRWMTVSAAACLLACVLVILGLQVSSNAKRTALADRRTMLATRELTLTRIELRKVEQRAVAACDFYRVVGTISVKLKVKPSLILMQFISSARVAYHGLTCKPPLPRPAALEYWLHYYKLGGQ